MQDVLIMMVFCGVQLLQIVIHFAWLLTCAGNHSSCAVVYGAGTGSCVAAAV